ncbi:sigma-54 interaction domain protein [Candidatus Vecturithrix granuli]|uniref:Sigma-54 interaction domain protein n=1 Tax=Vecturithrix granuli TaxID=1499967 RepID=A0A081C1R7_VECG1|nr:sigma-54 interaction domain protein [Candidatus Vecturithrix granuli]
MIDKNEFFRQMTIRICSTLDIEMALQRCYLYLTDILPSIYDLSLIFFDLELKQGGLVAEVIEGQCGDSYRFETQEFFQNHPQSAVQLRKLWRDLEKVTIINHPAEYALFQDLYQFAGSFKQASPDVSLFMLRLELEYERLGILAIAAQGRHRFTQEHTALFSLLNEPFAIALSNALRFHEISAIKDALVEDNRLLRQELSAPHTIIGAEFGLRQVIEMVQEVSALNSPVLLMGETGTGKEVIANAIHASSTRRNEAFIKLNCGAIPENLIDSELFGYEKGAFTGAMSRKTGYFERANRGTIFLDEIGELPLPAQVRLLRVLQTQEFERVGGARPIRVDTRVIAATHRNLPEMVKQGRFREDLWFRLNVFPIFIPPLRQRPEDLSDLTLYFLKKKAEEMILPVPEIEAGTFARLAAYHWPGNVRELENVIERALIRHRGGALRIYPGDIVPTAAPAFRTTPTDSPPVSLDEAMAAHIKSALTYTDWKISGPGGAAELLGLHQNTLRHRMLKLGIPLVRQQKQSKSHGKI